MLQVLLRRKVGKPDRKHQKLCQRILGFHLQLCCRFLANFLLLELDSDLNLREAHGLNASTFLDPPHKRTEISKTAPYLNLVQPKNLKAKNCCAKKGKGIGLKTRNHQF